MGVPPFPSFGHFSKKKSGTLAMVLGQTDNASLPFLKYSINPTIVYTYGNKQDDLLVLWVL